MNKLISIVVPIYNSEKYLKKTLDSILKQDYPYFEVIMVNDGSTDNSESICKKKLADKRFKYHYIKNSGVFISFNYSKFTHFLMEINIFSTNALSTSS